MYISANNTSGIKPFCDKESVGMHLIELPYDWLDQHFSALPTSHRCKPSYQIFAKRHTDCVQKTTNFEVMINVKALKWISMRHIYLASGSPNFGIVTRNQEMQRSGFGRGARRESRCPLWRRPNENPSCYLPLLQDIMKTF